MTENAGKVELRTARTAFAGAILGALIGGAGTFGGTLLSNQSQKSQELREEQRVAYAQLLEESYAYQQALRGLGRAVEARDQEQFDEQVVRVRDQARLLYNAMAEGYLLIDDTEVIGDLDEVYLADHIFYEGRVDTYDVEALRAATFAGEEVMTRLLREGREALRDD